MPGFGNLSKYTALHTTFAYAELQELLYNEDDTSNVRDENWYSKFTGKTTEYDKNEEERENIAHINVIRRILGTNKNNTTDMLIYDFKTHTIEVVYYNVTLAKMYPDGRVLFNPVSHYRTKRETKKRLNYIANDNGGSVCQEDGTWFLYYETADKAVSGKVEYGVRRWANDSLLAGNYERIEENDARYPHLALF